jgi:outer membrane receptor for ferrienterochelin and colicin
MKSLFITIAMSLVHIIKYLLLPAGILISVNLFSQTKKDSFANFKVYGACEQCKQRIETAAKIRGVVSAFWDIDTRNLMIDFDASKTTVEKIQSHILSAGHDLENKRATDASYTLLPACCHYRQFNLAAEQKTAEHRVSLNDTSATIAEKITGHLVKGVVLEADKKGGFVPLTGASVMWLAGSRGAFTDTNGVFTITHQGGNNRLLVSYTGYKADTITVTSFDDLKVVLATNKELSNVIITSRQHSSFISATNAMRTQVITEKELFKAACCNLSESFETNPSVDVSYNDAVTGSKQIQLLGLSGNYTQLTVENLPGPRGIATPLGLNSIAGPWVESIQLTKGIGSVANGYESIAGQINIELKKPESSERLYANLYVNEFGKTDLNVNLSQKLNNKWSAGLLLHDDFLYNKTMDQNKDGFRDMPTGNQFSLINRYKYDNGKGWLAQFGVKLLKDDRTGGETAYNPVSDKFTTNHYGLGIKTNRYEGFAKIGYVFPAKKYQSIGLQMAAISHQQDSYFGLTAYNAKQQNLYGNLIYQSIIANTAHKFRTGLSFVYDNYNENFKLDNYRRKEMVPGAFFEYTYTPSEKLNVVAGLRADQHNLFGFFATPRLHVRYEPFKGTNIRVSVGRGQRTANIFAENTSVFVSARSVEIIGAENGKAYGLNAEVAWNKGISIDQKFKLVGRDASFALDYFRNDFANQVVVDLEDTRKVQFYNLTGKSYSNSFQAEVNAEPASKLDIRLAWRFFDVKTTFATGLMQRPLIARNRAFANIAYTFKGFKFDYTVNYIGSKRLPSTSQNPLEYQLKQKSAPYVLMNAQVSKTVFKNPPVDFYFGVENLTNFVQKNPIIAARQPFGEYFDASLIWGPLTGSMFYAGLRYKLKQ